MDFNGNQTVQGPKRHFSVSVQTIQRALNDFRRRIRVLSRETIAHLKRKTKFKIYKLKWLPSVL